MTKITPEADARVTAALLEAAKIAKASDLNIGNAADRVARVTAREILALVPDAGGALDRAIAEAVMAEREAVCRIIHDAITTGTVAPGVGVALQDAIRARGGKVNEKAPPAETDGAS